MSSGAFGAPVPGGAPAEDTQHHNGGEAPAPAELIDPNDPRLTSESLDVDVTKDAYATPTLPPDGKYRAKLKHEGVKNDKGEVLPYVATQTKKAPIIPFFQTSVSASIIDPTGRFDGFTVFPQFGGMIGTLLQKDHSSKVSTLLSRILKPDGQYWATANMGRMTHKDWIDLLIRALAGEPEIGIETQWEWNCQKCGEEAKASNYAKGYPATVRGMQRFPAEQDKNKRLAGDLFSPEMKCQVNPAHGYWRGYPKIARFLSLAELKGPQQAATAK